MNTFIKYKIKEGVEKWSDKDIHTKYKPSSNDSTADLVKSAWKHLRAYSQFLYWSGQQFADQYHSTHHGWETPLQETFTQAVTFLRRLAELLVERESLEIKWCQTHPLDYSSDCSENLSPRSKSYDIDVGKVRRWGVCSEVVAPIHWVHGNLVRSCAWSPVLLYLESLTVTMATPAKTTTQNWRTKCHLLKWTETFQKINHFQNVKRAAAAHSYYLTL